MKTKQDDSPKASLPSQEDTNQKREVGMFQPSSDFDRIDQENPFVGMSSNPCGGKKPRGAHRGGE
jgi:hypothetical protein